MPGALLRAALALLAFALAAAGPASAQPRTPSGTAQVAVEVPAGSTKTVRLRNLPRGTERAVRIEANGALVVALVSGEQLRAPNPEALFKAALDRRISFKVAIPEASHYYLVLDNRKGSEAVKARATMQVRRPRAPSGGLDKT